MTAANLIAEAQLPLVDLHGDSFWQNIHEPLATAREQSPAMRTSDGTIYVLRADDVDAMLKDGRFVASDLLGLQGLQSGPVWEWWMRVMFSRNPPDHTRLRRLVGKAFTAVRVDEFRPEIRRQVAELLEPAFDAGRIEVIGELSHVLTSDIVAGFLGIPRNDWEIFREWTSTIGLAFGAATDPDIRTRVESALAELDSYVEDLLIRRRADPGDDLLSALLQVEEAGDRLSRRELVDLVENLMFAGHDTTRSGIAVIMKVLADHPDAFAAVRADPALVAPAVDEALRFENIIFTTVRQPAEDLDFLGYRIPAGTPLAASLPAACRDPRRYENPIDMDLRRTERTMIFGVGIHYCLGAALARAEMQEVVDLVARRCTAIELESPVHWVPMAHIRRPDDVKLSLHLP